MNTARVRRAALVAGLIGALLLALPAPVRAGDDAGSGKKKAKKPHLQYRKTYLEALTEARIRNLPVLVSRHKDF